MDQMQADTEAVAKNPTPAAIAQLSAKYPQMSQQFKQDYDKLAIDLQQARLNQSILLYAAIQSGNVDTAVGLLNKQADAYQDVGNQQQAIETRTIALFVNDYPATAKITIGILLSSIMGPKKFTDTFEPKGSAEIDWNSIMAEAAVATKH